MLMLELKSGKGRMSKEQVEFHLQAMTLKHTIHEVRSFKRFLEIAEEGERNGPKT